MLRDINMDKTDFLALFKRHKHKKRIFNFIWQPVLCLSCLGLIYLQRSAIPRWCWWTYFVFFACFFTWSFLYELRRDETVLIKRGLFCPQCSHPFRDADSKIVISTGKCPYCSFAVIDG